LRQKNATEYKSRDMNARMLNTLLTNDGEHPQDATKLDHPHLLHPHPMTMTHPMNVKMIPRKAAMGLEVVAVMLLYRCLAAWKAENRTGASLILTV
jgi:hypothetical protein